MAIGPWSSWRYTHHLHVAIFLYFVGPLAQSVEQRTFNPWVVGSSPTGPTLPGQIKRKAILPNLRYSDTPD